MPEPTHPPYVAGATTIPRQLERWLDINPQNGALTRTQGTFTIPLFDFTTPAYSIEFPYHGATASPTLIGAVFNFTSQNVFSLKSDSVNRLFGSVNYTLVIASKNPDATLTRYILWQGEPVIPIVLTRYAGEPINKTFRIEIWFEGFEPNQEIISVAQGLLTSVLGDVDYRYGTDFPIETLQSSVLDSFPDDAFGVTMPSNLPMIMPVNTYI